MHPKVLLFCLAGIFLAGECSAQFNIAEKARQLKTSMAAKAAAVPVAAPDHIAPVPGPHQAQVVAGAPTIINIQPLAQIAGGEVMITGTNFDDRTTVTFGGVAPKKATVSNNGTTLTAVIGKSGGSEVVVTNGSGSTTAPGALGFTFISKAPTIRSVFPAKAAAGAKVLIKGTNFQAPVMVSFKTAQVAGPVLISSTEILATVPDGATSDTVTVTINGVTAVYPAKATSLDANADLTVPNLGQGITIIPTPTFTYSNVHANKWLTYTSSIWANSFGTDSTRQAVGSKLLLAQTSLFGFKLAGNVRFTNIQSSVDVALYGEENLLVKKVGFYDVNAKTNTNFNPLVLQTRIGPTVSLNDNFFLGAYENILSVESENANVSTFFQTGSKNVFAYTEMDAAGIFPLSKGSSQKIKAEVDLIINNKDANYFYNSANSVIPYFKIGFVTGL